MLLVPFEHETKIRSKNMDDFESYKNAIEIDYDSGDVIFTRYRYKLNTPQFQIVKRSASVKCTNYMKEIVEFHGQNYFISTSAHCFLKSFNYLTGKDYTEEFLTFNRIEKYRSGVMTSARNPTFCRKYNINVGYSNGKDV